MLTNCTTPHALIIIPHREHFGPQILIIVYKNTVITRKSI